MYSREKNLELHFKCSTPISASERELYERCESIYALEGKAFDLVALDYHKLGLCVARNIPRIYEIRAALYSKEQESDDNGYPVPAKTIEVLVRTLSKSEEAVREALAFYLDDYYIGGYSMPYEQIDEELLF